MESKKTVAMVMRSSEAQKYTHIGLAGIMNDIFPLHGEVDFFRELILTTMYDTKEEVRRAWG